MVRQRRDYSINRAEIGNCGAFVTLVQTYFILRVFLRRAIRIVWLCGIICANRFTAPWRADLSVQRS